MVLRVKHLFYVTLFIDYFIITTKQHGFFGGRFTTTNLYLYVDYILKSLNKGEDVHTIYTDISKAFDSVDHGILS